MRIVLAAERAAAPGGSARAARYAADALVRRLSGTPAVRPALAWRTELLRIVASPVRRGGPSHRLALRELLEVLAPAYVAALARSLDPADRRRLADLEATCL